MDRTAKLVEITCPLCGSEDRDPWASEGGYSAVKCAVCGLVFVSPRADSTAISEASRTGLHETDGGHLEVVGRFRSDKVRKYGRRLRENFPGAYLERDLAWLDVGAGFGELLLALRETIGPNSRLVGVEPCAPKAREARARGLDVREGGLSVVRDARFDVISLLNVLSHLPDPCEFLTELAAILNPEGELFVVTGNGGDIGAEDYPKPFFFPDHLVFVGESHLIALLEKAGLEVIQLKKYRHFLPEGRTYRLARFALNVARRRPHEELANIILGSGEFRFMAARARLVSRSPT